MNNFLNGISKEKRVEMTVLFVFMYATLMASGVCVLELWTLKTTCVVVNSTHYQPTVISDLWDVKMFFDFPENYLNRGQRITMFEGVTLDQIEKIDDEFSNGSTHNCKIQGRYWPALFKVKGMGTDAYCDHDDNPHDCRYPSEFNETHLLFFIFMMIFFLLLSIFSIARFSVLLCKPKTRDWGGYKHPEQVGDNLKTKELE